MSGSLKVEERPNGVRVLTLSNPGKKNALDSQVLTQLEAAVSAGESVRAWLIQGEGQGIFSAGWDLHALSSYSESEPLPDERLSEVLDTLMHHRAPSVAVLDGPVFGAAGELAMACDFRIGGPGAIFSMPPARLGVVYALRGLERFRSKVGDATTRWVFLTGKRIGAEEALRRGLLDELSETPRVHAQQLADELALLAPLAVAGLKQGLQLLAEGGGTPSEREAYEGLRRASFNSADAAEGRQAILERRQARFRGV